MRLKSWMKSSWFSWRKMLEMQESISFMSQGSSWSAPFSFYDTKSQAKDWGNHLAVNLRAGWNDENCFIGCVCVCVCAVCFTGLLKVVSPLSRELLSWRKSWPITEVLCSLSKELFSTALHHSVKRFCFFSSENQIVWDKQRKSNQTEGCDTLCFSIQADSGD